MGHSISLPDRFAYTVHINNFVRDFIRAFFKDFSVRGVLASLLQVLVDCKLYTPRCAPNLY